MRVYSNPQFDFFSVARYSLLCMYEPFEHSQPSFATDPSSLPSENTGKFDVLEAQENLSEPAYRIMRTGAFAEEASASMVQPEPDVVSLPAVEEVEETGYVPAIPAADPQPMSRLNPSASTTSHPYDPDLTIARPKGESVFWIDIEKIEPNPYQPRREFDDDALQSLADSIRVHGILQPVVVAKAEVETLRGLDVRYQLIAGERRWRAAKRVGLREIPAVIKRGQPREQQKLEWALIENVQREDLNSIERARAFKQLFDEFRIPQKEIANRIGKSREYVANTIRLLVLPQEIQVAVASNVISEGHARALLSLQDIPVNQKKLFEDIKEHQLGVRDTELATRAILGIRRPTKRRNAMFLDPEVRFAQSRLEETLGTKVLLQKEGSRGKIVVEFYSDEELRAILDKITSRKEMA